MLLGLLPGLRQLRAPFIAGVLYLLVAWIVLDGQERLQAAEDSKGLGRLAELSEVVGPGATLAAAGLMAYLLGTFLVVRDWPQFWTRQHWRLLRSTLTKEEFANWRQGRPVRVFLENLWDRVAAIWRGGRRSITSIPLEFSDWRRRQYPDANDIFDPVYGYERADGLGTEMTVRKTHEWAGRLDYWVTRQMDNLHRTFTYRDLKAIDPPDDFWGAVSSAWRDLRNFQWRRANHEWEYRGGDWAGGLDQESLPENVHYPPRYFDLRDDQIPPWKPTNNGWDENSDHDWWDFDENLDEDAHHVVLGEAFLASLPEERQRLIAKLKAQGEVHYNDYDRAKAEAELRYSAAPPLILLCLALAVLWSPLAVLGLAAPVLMVRQGLAIERAGVVDLYMALQYAGVQSPTMALLYECRARARLATSASEAAAAPPAD